MKVFVAGAGGALGRQLVPMLVARGHEVTGTTTSEAKVDLIRKFGAEPVVLDVLDARAVREAVLDASPDVVVHEATALSGSIDLRHFDRDFALTNRLRTEGTDNLLAAALAAGATRFVAQSFAGWPFARNGAPVKTEDAALDPDPAPKFKSTLDAIRHLESVVAGAEGLDGVVLRYGGFYGPGTSLSRQGEYTEMIRKRRFPIVGDGSGIWSFVHIEDAAAATVEAVEHGHRGLYNVVDDEPARVSEWLPVAAKAAGGKPPRHVPLWLGRVLAGDAVVVMMTEVRGASNEKAKSELGWEPRHPSWRNTFTEVFAA
ncbi:MAG: NAD-dependent epimerase/dehydratase family protein [Thermoleophilaceae bacterium]